MTSYVFIDTVIQVFESDGNLHIIGGLSNGQVDTNGKDQLDKSLHLTIPMKKALKILPEIVDSLPKIIDNNLKIDTVAKDSSPSKQFEGQGLHFNI